MTGKLYVIGVGPGDPELLTLKAARIIKSVPVLCVPKGKDKGTSLALSIIREAVSIEGKEIVELHFPMMKTASHTEPSGKLDCKWNEAADAILSRLAHGDAAFITVGDPGIYSTFFHLYGRLLERMPELAVEIVPGISSINASAARAGIYLGLGNDRIAILPANYLDSLKETLETFDTVVLLKVNKVFGTLRDTLIRMNLAPCSTYVERVGMEDERICKDIRTVKEGNLNYFSLVIVRRP